MEHEDLFGKLDHLMKEIKRFRKENPTCLPDGELEPRLMLLLNECQKIAHELDFIMRSTYRNHPKKLAAWEEVITMCDELLEDNADKPES